MRCQRYYKSGRLPQRSRDTALYMPTIRSTVAPSRVLCLPQEREESSIPTQEDYVV